MKIGISGHRHRDGADWLWTREALADVFIAHTGAIGWSSLAVGADQIFAEISMIYGEGHVAVVPTGKRYRDEFSGRERLKYDQLLRRSRKRITVKGKTMQSTYRRAGERVVKCVDLMVFVWDGQPARGEGGTAEIVDYARHQGVDMILIDPIARQSIRKLSI